MKVNDDNHLFDVQQQLTSVGAQSQVLRSHLGRAASPPLTAENGLARYVCYQFVNFGYFDLP